MDIRNQTKKVIENIYTVIPGIILILISTFAQAQVWDVSSSNYVACYPEDQQHPGYAQPNTQPYSNQNCLSRRRAGRFTWNHRNNGGDACVLADYNSGTARQGSYRVVDSFCSEYGYQPSYIWWARPNSQNSPSCFAENPTRPGHFISGQSPVDSANCEQQGRSAGNFIWIENQYDQTTRCYLENRDNLGHGVGLNVDDRFCEQRGRRHGQRRNGGDHGRNDHHNHDYRDRNPCRIERNEQGAFIIPIRRTTNTFYNIDEAMDVLRRENCGPTPAQCRLRKDNGAVNILVNERVLTGFWELSDSIGRLKTMEQIGICRAQTRRCWLQTRANSSVAVMMDGEDIDGAWYENQAQRKLDAIVATGICQVSARN